jgi:hypothetical protein
VLRSLSPSSILSPGREPVVPSSGTFVILSEAKNLVSSGQIRRFAQNDTPRFHRNWELLKLHGQVELPKELVDELLAALVQSRIVRVAETDGVRWYFGWRSFFAILVAVFRQILLLPQVSRGCD